MAARPARSTGWTAQHVRHAAELFKQGSNPAARVYESIGSDFFLALAPGWLNLGLWEGSGSDWEAEAACRRLVETVAASLPKSGVEAPELGTFHSFWSHCRRPRASCATKKP